jgi:hypothetical protein
LSEQEPIRFSPLPRPRSAAPGAITSPFDSPSLTGPVRFDRQELSVILDLYGRKVAAGLWRDYAIDLLRDKAVFSVFRKSTEFPLYRIEKAPKLARKQGAYSVVAAGGLILKRGPELKKVLGVLESRIALASG